MDEATFLFADIAGFTALTEAHGDEAAFALVAECAAAVRTELPRVQGEHVKTIGDALMLRVPEPADAILLGLQIAHDLLIDRGAPAVRVGLHHGPAVQSEGDYFGAAVNLAARVSPLASGRGARDRQHRRTRSRPPDRAAGRLVHDGKAYFFCSLTCAGAFAQQPEGYA